jgi:hypothetical protein
MRNSKAFTILALLVIVSVAFAGGGKNHQKEQTRPIPLGVSGGDAEGPCFAGTLGCLVKSGSTFYILSNNHVFSRNINDGTGDDVTQPAKLDNGCVYDATDIVASVFQFVTIDFSGGDNKVDAAIAAIVSGAVNTDGKILGIGTPDGSTVADAVVGLEVRKAGRTTGVTKGTVQFESVTIQVNYGGGKVAKFVDQIGFGGGGFSKPGDSGSLIMTNDLKPVALLFAGGDAYTFGNPIQAVLDAFGVEIVGNGEADGGKGGGKGGGKPDKPDKPGKPPKSQEVLGRHGKKLLATAGVTGHGIGRHAGQDVITVFVEKDTSELRGKLPKQLEGIPVRIVVTGKVTPY